MKSLPAPSSGDDDGSELESGLSGVGADEGRPMVLLSRMRLAIGVSLNPACAPSLPLTGLPARDCAGSSYCTELWKSFTFVESKGSWDKGTACAIEMSSLDIVRPTERFSRVLGDSPASVGGLELVLERGWAIEVKESDAADVLSVSEPWPMGSGSSL